MFWRFRRCQTERLKGSWKRVLPPRTSCSVTKSRNLSNRFEIPCRSRGFLEPHSVQALSKGNLHTPNLLLCTDTDKWTLQENQEPLCELHRTDSSPILEAVLAKAGAEVLGKTRRTKMAKIWTSFARILQFLLGTPLVKRLTSWRNTVQWETRS